MKTKIHIETSNLSNLSY